MKPIKNETEYLDAINRIDALVDKDPHPSSKEGKELQRLIKAVDVYEDLEDKEL